MKKFLRTIVAFFFAVSLFTPAIPLQSVNAASGTGYTKASDVKYVTTGKYIHNWGARDEECVFLSEYAEDFYTGEYTYNILSQKTGGTAQNNAKGTALFTALQTKMSSAHTFFTYYDGNKNVRQFYKYADCVKSDTSKVSLIYLGTMVSSTWDAGNTWNQEHMWPKSKLGSSEEIGDIMQLHASNPSENSSRGNTAYGKSKNYYDPNKRGQSVRGDAARMALYMYVRYGSSSMWGSGGVIESMEVLLEWMKEDPVDTWEMGRNDAVQSITGTRNVFVDYPELAWKLFGKEIPKVTTPSGIAKNGAPTTPDTPVNPSTPVNPPVTPNPPVNPDTPVNPPVTPDTPVEPNPPVTDKPTHEHNFSDWVVTKAPTEKSDGEKIRACNSCGLIENVCYSLSGCIHDYGDWVTLSNGTEMRTCNICRNTAIKEAPKNNSSTIITIAVCGGIVMIAGAVFVFIIIKKKA